MMDEELLFAEWDKYLICRSLLEQFEKSKREDFISLIKVCRILCRSKLLRLTEDIRGYFDWGIKCWGVPKPKTHFKSLHPPCKNGFGFMKGVGSNPTIDLVSTLRKVGDSEKTLLAMVHFVYYFNKKDPNCFYWTFQMFYSKEKGGRRYKRTDCEYIIWEYLFQQSGENKYLKKCLQYKLEEYFVKHRGERFIWLTASIMMVMYKDDIDWDPQKLLYDIEVTQSDMVDMYKDRRKLEIDGYAIDMHCSMGRKMGKNKRDFIKEGSVVINEDKEYFVQEWRDMYNDGNIRSCGVV